jgi:hypothetical protein
VGDDRGSAVTEDGVEDQATLNEKEMTLPAPPAVGQTAPEFRLESIAGRPAALADFRGRRVVLWLSRGIY